MNESRSLQRLAIGFLSHPRRRQSPQVVIKDSQEFL
jgi:hypothetical protein